MEKDINHYLIGSGWTRKERRHSNRTKVYYKTCSTKTKCYANDNPSGVLIVIESFDLSIGHRHEIRLRAEAKDGFWINFSYYSLGSDELIEKLEHHVKKLLLAWEAINKE
jgi:hypothetical protein